MHATNAFESALGAQLFQGTPLTITEWHIGLFTTAPNEAGTGGVEVSSTDTGYARQPLPPSPANWGKRAEQDAEGRTVFYNGVAVQFSSATLNWGTVTHLGLWDQNSQLCFVAPLTANKAVNVGDAPVFLAGELEIAIG